MATTLPATPETLRQIQRVQGFTIAWMIIEAAVSLSAAWMARSPALLAFGGDSTIELLSAILVLWLFRGRDVPAKSEKLASRAGAVLLFVLAGLVTAAAAGALLGYTEPESTYLGMAILIAAAAIMPWLAREKRRLSAVTGSVTLRADAAESAVCAYLSWIALVGVAINAIWHIQWADPIAALAVVPIIVYEGREALRGRPCGCCPQL